MVSSCATPGAMTFLPARVAGHEVRLDETGGDAQLRLDEAAVELHRRAPPGGHAEIDVRRVVPREVILDAHRVEHPGVADDFGQLRALVRPMQAGRDQHGDALARHPGREHALDQRPQEQVIRDRPRDVADQDAGALATAHQRAVRRRPDRARQRVAHGRLRIGQLRHRPLADHGGPRALRQPDLQFRTCRTGCRRCPRPRSVHRSPTRFDRASRRARAACERGPASARFPFLPAGISLPRLARPLRATRNAARSVPLWRRRR